MDDHFWPAMYPGIIIGVLYGIGAGGWRSVGLGAVGGLAGSVLSYFALRWLTLPEGFITLAGTVAVSIAFAFLLVTIGRRMA